jgi:hypothetical protein
MPPSHQEDQPEFEWVAYEMIRGTDQREWHLTWAGGEISGDPRIRVLQPGKSPFVATLSELREQDHPIGEAKLEDFERDRPFAITPQGFRRGSRFWQLD